MPEPGTARRPTNARRSSKRVATSPKSTAPFDSTSIHDRIQQWQVQGAADALDPDTLSSRSPPRSDTCITPDRSQSGTPNLRQPRTTPRKNSTRWVQKSNRQWIKERRHGTHAQETKTSRDVHGEALPRTTDAPPNSPPVTRNDEELRACNISHSRAERDERRRRRREARALIAGGRNHDEDGIRVYPPSEPCHPAEHQDETDNVSNLPAPTDDHSQTQHEDKFDFEDDYGPHEDCHSDSDPNKTLHQPSKYAQTLGRAPEPVDKVGDLKLKKRDIFSKTKEILVGKPDQPVPTSNRLPSIQAWLEEQPDPFIDQDAPTNAEPVDVQRPLRLPSRPKRVSLNTAVPEDPNKIWDSVSPPQQPNQDVHQRDRLSSRKQSKTKKPERRKFSFEVFEADNKEEGSPLPPEYSEHQNESPVTLRRGGARARKSNPRAASLAKDAAEPLVELQQPASSTTPPEKSPTKKETKTKPLPKIPPVEENQNAAPFDLPTHQRSQGLKRKLTTHEDLISVLSQPRARRSTRSAKHVARDGQEGGQVVIQDLLNGMREEEDSYNKELRTLVDGVTPVLLQSFLSKTDASAAAGLFSSSQEDAHLTRSVIDMAVAVERLKSLHNRIPLNNVDSLLSWAQTAQRPYSDYVKAWRLGFQDVIVNLAPLNNAKTVDDDSMARDVDGDVVDAAGQKVDVAYLQKRPLVRLKRLSKLFCSLQDALPNNHLAAKMATVYADLTELARRRHRAEQGRLEDEAAAQIDTTRVRDIRSLAPLTSVKVDPQRRVRARDCFNMTVHHSSGQRMDCRIEIIIRDNQDSSSPGGDVLICQVEDEGQWLLFAPVELGKISARRGEGGCDLVIMVRGAAGLTEEWSELLALQTEDSEAAVEWMNMLGSNPLPPKLSRVPTYMSRKRSDVPQTQVTTTPDAITPTTLSAGALSSLPSDVDVPIGEPSELGRHRRRPSRPASSQRNLQDLQEKALPKLNLGGGLQKKTLPEHYQAQAARELKRRPVSSLHSSDRSTISGVTDSTSQFAVRGKVSASASDITRQDISPVAVNQNRYSPQKIPSQLDQPPGAYERNESSASGGTRPKSNNGLEAIPLISGALQDPPHEANLDDKAHPSRPEIVHRVSSTPEDQLPRVARTRRHTKSQSMSTPLTDSIRDQWTAISGMARRLRSQPSTPDKSVPSNRHSSPPGVFTEDLPMPVGKKSDAPPTTPTNPQTPALPPTPPPHQINLPSTQRSGSEPPQPGTPTPRQGIKPSSSPLKHEYAPSSRSSSSSQSSAEDSDSDSTSDTSDDLGSELEDQAMPLVPIGINKRRFTKTGQQPPSSMPSTGTRTLQPSDSASQGPYRRAPPSSAYPPEKKKRTIATVCSWSDKGIWEPIQDDECSIVVSPGLIQAFPMTEAHSQPLGGADWQQEVQNDSTSQVSPFVEFELTPIVPLRKGTALDITIRSPPTSNSKIQTTSNVMFRSRSAQECERLYNMINWARCNNPTYAALARSRAREPPTVTFATNVEDTKTRSWFSFGSRNKTRYRAPSAPPSSMGESVKSSSTTASAFSALKRFGVNSPFSLHRSSVVRRPGLSTVDSLYSSSTGTGQSSGSSTPAPSQAGFLPGKDGPNVPATSAEAASGAGMVNNMKIRLFVRVGQKWDALGACSLTVLPAVTSTTGADRPSTLPGSAPTTPPASRHPSVTPQSAPGPRQLRLPSSDMTPHRLHLDGREKRILITKHKNSSAVILDEILGESCFEKVMQTGIAVNVWTENSEVGVMTGRGKVYMMQFQTSSEAGWVFGMCGSFRYGDAAGI